MRIAFDATAMPRNRAGAGVYTDQLARALAAALPGGDRLLLLDRWGAFADLAGTAAVAVRQRRPRGRGGRIAWEQLALPGELARARPDVYHSPHHSMPLLPLACTAVVTVHDVTFRLLPWRYTAARRLYMHISTAISARGATRLIVPSRSVAVDLARLYPAAADRITVIAEAAPPSMRVIEDQEALALVRQQLNLPERFVLSVGTLEPGKNRANLLRAFALLRRRGLPHHLVIAGQPGWGDDVRGQLAASLGIAEAVQFTGYVSDAALPALYNLAEAFAFPSWREGFGLPPLEAMACGTAVVASDRPAMPEVLGDAACYAAPDDPRRLAALLERVLTDEGYRDGLRERGLHRAAGYSWQRAARETLALYRQVAGSSQ